MRLKAAQSHFRVQSSPGSMHTNMRESLSLIHHQPGCTFAIPLQTLKQLQNLHLSNAKCSFLPLGISATQNSDPKENDPMDGSPTES